MISPSQRRRPAALGYAIACRGITVRAQLRSVATLIEVAGALRTDKVAALQTQLRRFVLVGSPLIVDVSCVVGITGDLLQRLVAPIEIDCSLGNVELFVVVRHDLVDGVELRDGTEVVGSKGEALRCVVEGIRERRNPAFLSSPVREQLA